MRFAIRVGVVGATLGLAWAAGGQARKPPAHPEDEVRRAAFTYSLGSLYGDPETCLSVVRLPLTVVQDGATLRRDEKAVRAVLASLAATMKARRLSEAEKKELGGRMLARFDEAEIQWIGAKTAALTFLVRRGTAPEDGDQFAMLVLHREEGGWKVVAEVTDPKAVPPEYLGGPPPALDPQMPGGR